MNAAVRSRRMFGRASLSLMTSCALAGCSLFSSHQPAVAIYTLEAKLPAASTAAPMVAWRLVIARPRASQQLSSSRILVSPAPGVIEVYPKTQWSDPAPALIGDLLLETLESSGRILGLDRATSGLDADYQLSTELRDFQLELQPAPPRAMVRVYARLLRTRDNRIISARVFENQAAASSTDAAAAVAAFNEALSLQLPALADWTLQEAQRDWDAR